MHPTTLPALAIFISAGFWGTWWIPLRALDEVGIGGVWGNAAGLTLPLLPLLPLFFIHRRRLLSAGWALWASSFLIAAAMSLYAEALLRGQVAPVLLLFYLTTVWSTLLGRLILGQAINDQRLLSIVLSLCGAVVIFGADGGLPLPREAAEWMGLLSGFAWALGIVFLHYVEDHPLSDKVAVQFLFLGPLFIAFALLPGGRELSMPGLAIITAGAPWLFALAFLWTLPLMVLTLYGASKLDPGTVSILLTFEIVIGVATAWLFAGEAFGLYEALGAALIMAAVSSEFFANLLRARARPSVP